ncbi:chloride channel protein [Granulicella arctica]|uniref:chloride channel protein n=1 Tax=Granulicella arctica TaxID=940613 RepID=UPI0021E0D1D7|nr:chloride channel protein [Granulicella arctica]
MPTTPEPILDPSPTQSPAGREDRIFLVLSIFIGVISGLLVVAFRMAIDWLTVLLRGSSPQPHQLRLIIVPTLAGIVIALLVRYVFPEARGSGINQTKAALYIRNGYISSRTVVGKFLLCALALGAGYSSGPEDPSLQIGAGVASLVSRRFGLSRARLRVFAPIGAAAGLAAAFNAPISAILFVIEEVIGNWSAAVLGSIVLSAISGVVVARAFWGAAPMFRIPAVTLVDSRELLAYAVLGVVGGIASLVFTKALGWLRPLARRQSAAWQLAQPAIAGFLVGCIAYLGLPQIMGAGYDVMDQAMHAQFAWKMLLLLAAFKIIATTISFSSGTPGGMFAPTLFIGAMLGASVGTFEKLFFPHLTGSVGSYALVGMGVLFAAFMRAPLTSVFMVLEVSGNYSIVLPVIIANTIAYLISRSLQPAPILEIFTHQDGLDLPSMEEQREEANLHLEDALHPITVPVLQGSETIAETIRSLAQYSESTDEIAILIHCTDQLWYAATRHELEALMTEDEASLEAKLGPERTPVLFPDLPLSSALPHFQRWPLLPITNRAMRGSLEGAVSLEDVLKRYQQHEPSH